MLNWPVPAMCRPRGRLTVQLYFASFCAGTSSRTSPCRIIARSASFFTALGWRTDERYGDDNAACFVLADGVHLMVSSRAFFASLGDGSKQVGDPPTTTLVAFAFHFPSRDEVDAFIGESRRRRGEDRLHRRLRLHVSAGLSGPGRQPVRAILDAPGRSARKVTDRSADQDGADLPDLVTALELVGPRWALLVVGCLLDGPKRYGDLQRELGAPTNMLAMRLTELQAAGILYRLPLAHRQRAYVLTDRGAALRAAITALAG